MLFTTEAEDRRFWELVREFDRRLAELTEAKGADYNKVASMPDYCPGGWQDSAVMLWKHSLRFLQFRLHPKDLPKNETVNETLLDIANYARYTYAMRRLEEQQDAEARGRAAARNGADYGSLLKPKVESTS